MIHETGIKDPSYGKAYERLLDLGFSTIKHETFSCRILQSQIGKICSNFLHILSIYVCIHMYVCIYIYIYTYYAYVYNNIHKCIDTYIYTHKMTSSCSDS